MKIYNRKIAKRIKDREALAQNLAPSNSTLTSAQWYSQIIPLCIAIAQDIETLRQHGYDRDGDPLSKDAAWIETAAGVRTEPR